MISNKRSPSAAAAVLVLLLTLQLHPAFSQEQQQLPEDSAGLVAVLENPDAPVFDKAKACQRLAVVGTKAAIPALAALLSDESLAAYARSGLEGIPDPAADEALRQAAEKLNGRQLIGVINSIGKREDTQAAALLRELLKRDDPAVVSAAAVSLGQVAPGEAVDTLTKTLSAARNRSSIADACLICAETLTASGKHDEAVALYEAVADADVPDHLRADALQGQIRLLKQDAKDLLLEQIRSNDERFFNLGLAMAREVSGEDVAQALIAELQKLSPPRKALLLRALGDRPEAVPLEVLAAARRSESAEVRAAAIRVLGTSNDSDALAMLFDAAFGDDETAPLARESLKRHPAGNVDTLVLARLKDAQNREKPILFDLVGARRIDAAQPSVASALSDTDAAVRGAALAALAQIVELNDLALLVNRAQEESGETAAARAALSTAAQRMSDRDACAARLAEGLKEAPAGYQVFILDLLGKLGSQRALEAVVSRVKSGEPQIKDSATRVLGDWPNAEAAAALFEIAKNDSERRYRIRALRGYLRIARQLQQKPEERLAMFHAAMEIAERDDEKQLALDILSRIPSKATLELAVAHLSEPTLRAAAADAAVKIAPPVLESDPQAVAGAMQKVVDSGVGGDVGARARQFLNRARSQAP